MPFLISGGCVAQEIIKLITKQYKPVNNTFIYNAMIFPYNDDWVYVQNINPNK